MPFESFCTTLSFNRHPFPRIALLFIHKRETKRRKLITLRAYIEPNCSCKKAVEITGIIIHQTHYEKSDWSRAFNQFTIACELDMINAVSAADITFIMSSLQAIVN